jgi:hypothetical protein
LVFARRGLRRRLLFRLAFGLDLYPPRCSHPRGFFRVMRITDELPAAGEHGYSTGAVSMKNSQLALDPRSHVIELPDQLQDAIRGRAYEIYEQRAGSGMDRSAEADWLQAEAEILTRQFERKAA